MLSGLMIRNILQNKKYFANGFYKNEFREFEGNIELDDGQVISYEQVEERMGDEENYLDHLFYLLEIEKDENEGYYCNMVFFNKCDSKGYWAGFDVNGFDENGFNKKGYNIMGFNIDGYIEDGNHENIENWFGFDINDLEGYDTVRL